MSKVCPECGAFLEENTTCQDIFDSLLALEYSDPSYGEVHFLTVACFMIQHGRYSDEGLRWIEQKLRAHLEDGVPVDVIRRRAAEEADQANRAWKVARSPGAAPLPKIAWSLTIADVAAHRQDAASYRDRVREWARTTLQEMKPLI